MVLRALGVAMGWFTLGALAAGMGALWWMHTQGPSPEAVRDALLKDPEILAAAPQIMASAQAVIRSRAQDARAAARRELIRDKWARVMNASFAPGLGDSDADSVLIEFTDYGCEPCRATAPAVEAVLDSLPHTRVVILLLPTSGPVSEFAARVAYAAWLQDPGRFVQFNRRMMSSREEVTTQTILRHAADCGLDLEQLQDEANSSEVRGHLAQVREFAEELHVGGVPTFVGDGRLLSGGVSAAQLVSFARSIPRTMIAARPAHPFRPEFSLVDQTGEARTLAAFHDRWLLVYFGFTRCPDVCPTSLMRLSQALRAMGEQARNITPALVTVDPEHDSPEILARYVKSFGSAFVGLTGTRAQVSAALDSFGAYSEPAEDPQSMPSHSASFYLVDPGGNLRRRISSELGAPQIAQALRKSLEQSISDRS